MNYERGKRVFDMREAREKRERPKLKIKPRKWQHQDELERCVGKAIVVVFRDREIATGRLLAADQFTVKIDCEAGPVTFFKHTMFSYAFDEEAR
jgi:hypothetical protein